MEIKDIISSGLLELYAAGLTTDKETNEVAQWLAQYPEVAAEFNVITACIEEYAKGHAVIPSPSVKEKLFAYINQDANNKVVPLSYKETNKVLSLNTVPSFWRMVAAASVLLLIGSVALNIFTYNKYNEAGNDLVATKETLNALQEKNKITEEGMSVVQNKYSVPVSLNGLEAAPDAAAKVFWMKNTGEVFIDASNLPDAPQGKQYQLWGIVDGKPVDGGMILTSKKGDKYRIQKMKNFGKADAFAVTLEPEKGNPTPQGPMYVMGKM